MSPKPLPHKQSLGTLGESLAASYLTSCNYRIIYRNFKARYGEIDIIATHQNTLVFVEVKTRLSTRFGIPEESVTPKKLREVINTAEFFTITHKTLPTLWRIDVIAIVLEPGTYNVSHFNHIRSVTS